MLGNFSFGDYFKAEAIDFAWTLLTKELNISPDRLWITVFEEDEEAETIWANTPGVLPGRIQRLGAKDNFWSMGDTGPCGPSSEIFFDHGPEYGPDGGPATDSDRYVEIWNLVFMQFDRDSAGTMTPLPKPSIDTGAGLERICAALQNQFSNYNTDCFQSIIAHAAKLAKVTYQQTPATPDSLECDVALQVIADHSRSAAFLIADGVMPSNEERGYVLRRIMRRAIRYGVKIGLTQPFLWKVADVVIEHFRNDYPNLVDRQDFIREVIRGEEERFSETLQHGLALLETEFANLDTDANTGEPVLPGKIAFRLYDTFGFPLDLTRLIAKERGVDVDENGYKQAMEAQRAAGRAAWKGAGADALSDGIHALSQNGIASAFQGYDSHALTGRVQAILIDDNRVDSLAEGQKGLIFFDQTPFYGESGGQVGDTGTLAAGEITGLITDTQKPTSSLIAHQTTITTGTVRVGDEVTLTVNGEDRARTRRNHTATHLLHAALRSVLGDHVIQKGSLCGPNRLRFDFAHHKPMTQQEVVEVEALVYANILANHPVETSQCSMDEARKRGAMALFGEKYGTEVRLVDVPGFSIELCGGTHANRTGDIGLFRVVSESGIAAGVRRIEAQTGWGALELIRQDRAVLLETAVTLKSPIDQVDVMARKFVDERKKTDKELATLKTEIARLQAGDLTSQMREIKGIKVISAEFSGDTKLLRDEADRLRDKMGSSVVVLGARDTHSVKLVVTVSKDLAGTRVHAGNLVKQVAAMVGGGGGGRPDMAQAGGKSPENLPDALEKVYELVGA